MQRAQAGLTLLELAFILVVMGILASTLIPAIQAMHHKSLEENDRKALRTLKEVIIGQFLATGALPKCKDIGGNPTTNGNCDIEKSLGHLPVALRDSRNQPFKYDVWNDPASDLTGTTKLNACATLDTAIAAPALYPAICGSVPDYGAPSTTYCNTVQNIAFALVATGHNRPGQGGESANALWMSNTCPPNRNIATAFSANRIFERPERRAYAPCYYDDIVEVVTLQELKNKCPL